DTGLPSCGTSVDAPGVWYKFVGNGQNTIIHTCAYYNYDTKLNAYSGTCNGLVCVTGLDDFCAQGTQITFPTTNGTTYYILVQGWGGQQGNFTITRSCYSGPFYCQAGGAYGTYEWIKKVTLGSYVKNSGPGSYTDFSTDTITVSRGGTYDVTLTPGFLQYPRDEWFSVWMDYNKDGDFVDAGEQVILNGPVQSMYSTNFTIPVTVNTGVTRMRVMMSNTTISSSCGVFTYGEVEDYSIRIKCNLVTSTTDSGNGSLRVVSGCADPGEDILFASNLNGQTINVTLGTITCNGNWKWMASVGSNITIKAGGTVLRILTVQAGKSIEIQNLKLIGGTAATGNVIDNAGILKLRDCELHPPAGSTNAPLRNTSTASTTILGTTSVKF
ncbi:MAG TPA: GEVED domain-containing protein, partial [Saprospiraceae bacterium]|nr:GEVED domain-containing protein [Saprospiraceae bacterium]